MALTSNRRKEITYKLSLAKKKEIIIAKKDFWRFCLYMDFEFFNKRAEVLKPVAKAMQRVEEGELKLLYVGLPPRTGKSYITTLFCAWSLGKYPEESIMRNTVTGDLYSKFSEDLKDIMQGQSHNQKYLNVFPEINFKTEKVKGWKLESTKQGISYFGAGVGGSIIGFGASLVAILDDSIKNKEEALSDTMLEKKWGWYTSTHRSRVETGTPEIHIATRWSKKDIPGQLMQQDMFKGDKAKKIVIPALIDGKSYCPAAHTTEELLEEKKLNDEIIWEAEWQQSPVEAKGTLMSKDQLKSFKRGQLAQDPDAIIAYIDIADEGDDYLSCPIAYKFGKELYIGDVVFTQSKVEQSEPQVANALLEYDVDLAMFESNNGGKQFARNVIKLLKQHSGHTTVKWRATTSNKETRIIMQSGYIKEYFYFRTNYKLGSEYDDFMKQLTSWSKSGGNKHDDANDSVTGMAELIKGIDSRNKSNRGIDADIL